MARVGRKQSIPPAGLLRCKSRTFQSFECQHHTLKTGHSFKTAQSLKLADLTGVLHLGNGCRRDRESGRWRDGRGKAVTAYPALDNIRQARVVLACAHLNHDPTHNAPSNLEALCQRCHLAHDAHEHRHRRWRNRFIKQALRDFFDPNLRQ
jgi:hypothetical protein